MGNPMCNPNLGRQPGPDELQLEAEIIELYGSLFPVLGCCGDMWPVAF